MIELEGLSESGKRLIRPIDADDDSHAITSAVSRSKKRMWRGPERKHARRFSHIAADTPSPLFKDKVVHFFIPAVDGDIQATGFRPGREVAGTGHFQHRIATRSDLGYLREEMSACDLLILIKEVLPDLAEIVLLERVVV